MLPSPEEAKDHVDECVEEMREAVRKFYGGDGVEISDAALGIVPGGQHKPPYDGFLSSFAHTDKWDNPTMKEYAKQMARYIGIMARMHCEARGGPTIDNDDVTYACKQAKAICTRNIKAIDANDRPRIFTIWCADYNP